MGYKKGPAFKYINFGLSFGVTMAITLYVLYKGGGWLDQRLGTSPVFMMIGIILAVAAVFKRMITDLKTLDKEAEEDKKD